MVPELVEPGPRRVLIVDPSAEVRHEVGRHLGQLGYEVFDAESGQLGLLRFQDLAPSVVLLEAMLPDGPGLDVCREIRRVDAVSPVLIMGSSSDEIDVVVALEIGADDYLTKPLRLRELSARLAAHLRKAQGDRNRHLRGRLEFEDLIVDVNQRRVQTLASGDDGSQWVDVVLTHTEFDLLAYLAVNAGRVLSRERILNTIWGYDYPIETRVIDVHVRNLRKKIEPDPSRPTHVLAVPGIGYRFTNSRP